MNTPQEVSFAAAVRRARLSRGLSLRSLAYLVKKSHQWVSLVETGRLRPSEVDVRRLAQILGSPELVEAAGILPADVIGFLRQNPALVDQLRQLAAQE